MSDVERFWAENPEWPQGRRMVVRASDYDRLKSQYDILKERVDGLIAERDEARKQAALAKQLLGILVRVVK